MKRQWTLSEEDIKNAIKSMLREIDHVPEAEISVVLFHSTKDVEGRVAYSATAIEQDQ